MSKKVAEALRLAKAKIQNPENWCISETVNAAGQCCALGAIFLLGQELLKINDDAMGSVLFHGGNVFTSAGDALRKAAEPEFVSSINDYQGHEAIMALYDKAILAEESVPWCISLRERENMRKVISFDWDHTLFDDDVGAFIQPTLDLFRQHLLAGDRIIIVTSRPPKWIPEIHDQLSRICLDDVDVFSAPSDPDIPNGWLINGKPMLTKSQVLIQQGASVHFDDIPNHSALEFAIEMGIDVKLPPAISAKKYE